MPDGSPCPPLRCSEERAARASLNAEGEKFKASIRAVLYERAFAERAKVEQFGRMVIVREQDECWVELFQKHITSKWNVFFSLQARQRKHWVTDEETKRAALYDFSYRATTTLLRLVGMRRDMLAAGEKGEGTSSRLWWNAGGDPPGCGVLVTKLV